MKEYQMGGEIIRSWLYNSVGQCGPKTPGFRFFYYYYFAGI